MVKATVSGLCAAGLLAGAASAQTTPQAFADLSSAGDLLEVCGVPAADDNAAESAAFCYGYIIGAGQFYAETVRAGVMDPVACPEATPTLAQIRSSFVEWMGAHPEAGEARAVDGLMRAAADTWPCG